VVFFMVDLASVVVFMLTFVKVPVFMVDLASVVVLMIGLIRVVVFYA